MMNMVHSLCNGLWTIRLLHCTKRRKRNSKERETVAQSGGNSIKMVLHLNDTLNGPKCDEYGALSLHNGLFTIRLLHPTKRRKQNPREGETEAQSGGNGMKMVLSLNDTLNGPKCDEYEAL